MKKFIYGALIGVILAGFILLIGNHSNGAPFLAYVYSNSMEPLIKVNDSFLVLPTKKLQVGDIVMFRPQVLKAPYITHRIIAFGETGFITKGDNSYYKDQDSGEPEVIKDRIIGKVCTIHGQPIVIPGLGKFPALIKSGIGKYSIYLSAGFFLLGIMMLFTDKKAAFRKRKPRRRLRLRHLYKAITIIAAVIIMLSIYLGSRVTQIKYLVSEYPGTLGDQIEVNQPGQLTLSVNNNGLVPVIKIMKGVRPLLIQKALLFPPRSSAKIYIDVIPQQRTGVYQGYVQIYSYPAILPKAWILYLHNINPMFALILVGLFIYLLLTCSFRLLSQIHGLEAWIPLNALDNKIIKRRIETVKGKLLGRRRSR